MHNNILYISNHIALTAIIILVNEGVSYFTFKVVTFDFYLPTYILSMIFVFLIETMESLTSTASEMRIL